MIACFDLDDTLCSIDKELPLDVSYAKAKPITSMIAVVRKWYGMGHTIIIDTARGSSSSGLNKYYRRWKLKRLTERQLNQWKVPYHTLRVGVKPYADVYIDDKCLHPGVFMMSKKTK